jgi:hypothetical protein
MNWSAGLAAIPRQVVKLALGALVVIDPLATICVLGALVVVVAVVMTAALIVLARQTPTRRDFVLSVIRALRGQSTIKE